jgi:hypothetical protein
MIGTAHDSDLVLGDPLFPELHCYLLVAATGVTLRHIGEGPNFLYNGRETQFARCQNGDRLTVGPYEFQLHIEGGSGEDEGGDRPRLRTFDACGHDFDIAWQQTQMLLCDIPAPLRPLAIPHQWPVPRRAIA